jgi:hypothetical protein
MRCRRPSQSGGTPCVPCADPYTLLLRSKTFTEHRMLSGCCRCAWQRCARMPSVHNKCTTRTVWRSISRVLAWTSKCCHLITLVAGTSPPPHAEAHDTLTFCRGRKAGFPCPRGRGKGTQFPEDECRGKIDKSHPIVPKNEGRKKKAAAAAAAAPVAAGGHKQPAVNKQHKPALAGGGARKGNPKQLPQVHLPR